MMNTHKTFKRDVKNKWIGGVCAGMARYFGIDVLIVRLLCLILALAWPPLFLIYLLMMIIVPSDEKPDEMFYNRQSVEEEETHEQNKANLFLGLLLIVVGLIFLFDRYFQWIQWRGLWPVILIFLGIYFLIKSFTEANHSGTDTSPDYEIISENDQHNDEKNNENEKY